MFKKTILASILTILMQTENFATFDGLLPSSENFSHSLSTVSDFAISDANVQQLTQLTQLIESYRKRINIIQNFSQYSVSIVSLEDIQDKKRELEKATHDLERAKRIIRKATSSSPYDQEPWGFLKTPQSRNRDYNDRINPFEVKVKDARKSLYAAQKSREEDEKPSQKLPLYLAEIQADCDRAVERYDLIPEEIKTAFERYRIEETKQKDAKQAQKTIKEFETFVKKYLTPFHHTLNDFGFNHLINTHFTIQVCLASLFC